MSAAPECPGGQQVHCYRDRSPMELDGHCRSTHCRRSLRSQTHLVDKLARVVGLHALMPCDLVLELPCGHGAVRRCTMQEAGRVHCPSPGCTSQPCGGSVASRDGRDTGSAGAGLAAPGTRSGPLRKAEPRGRGGAGWLRRSALERHSHRCWPSPRAPHARSNLLSSSPLSSTTSHPPRRHGQAPALRRQPRQALQVARLLELPPRLDHLHLPLGEWFDPIPARGYRPRARAHCSEPPRHDGQVTRAHPAACSKVARPGPAAQLARRHRRLRGWRMHCHRTAALSLAPRRLCCCAVEKPTDLVLALAQPLCCRCWTHCGGACDGPPATGRSSLAVGAACCAVHAGARHRDVMHGTRGHASVLRVHGVVRCSTV